MKLNFKKFGKGCPLIIIHGLYGSGENWFTFGRQLSKFFTVYLIDLRNHGSSPHHHDLSFEAMSNDIEELMSNEQLDYACLMGHSLGGKIAMYLTLKNPEKVKKLVVIDVAPRAYIKDGNIAPQVQFHKLIIDALINLNLKTATSRSDIDKELSYTISQPALRKFLLKNIKRSHTGDYFWGLNLHAIRDNLAGLMAEIKSYNTFNGDTLIVYGSRSDYVNENDKQEFKKYFNNIRFEEFNTGHWLHAEEPEKLMNLLLHFLPLNER
ncbi:MAG: alpha/beta fold hydrolase [Bacteroidales bacterium]|nr:alpha/beta fold hydrolase [Bacteroidales bacterium]